ncbi:MAG: hypothetical protein RLZZ383_1096 [Pseudomonadota bacterium]|jgi:hypothetical protein
MRALAGWMAVGLMGCKGVGELVLGEPTQETDTGDSVPVDDTLPADPTTDTPVDSGSDTPVDTEPEVDPNAVYDDAYLEVVSPLPAALYASVDGKVALEGKVYGADGTLLPFRDVRWEVVELGTEVFVGRNGEVTTGFGVFTFEVSAALPNGDRLNTTIGGVRVQHPRAGIYAGSVAVDAVLTGLQIPLSSSCLGSLVFDVGLDGRVIAGDGGCTLAFPIGALSFDLAYAFEGVIVDPDASGDLLVDAGFFDIPLGWEGAFGPTGTLEGSFDGVGLSLFGYGFDLSGTIAADPITPYVVP